VAVAGLSRRAIAIVVAIILAIVATIALVSYIRGIEQEALRDVEAVEVFVARESIPEGMSGDEASEEGLIERETVPRTLVPEGAITSLEEVQGRVANTTVLQGEVISRGRFVAPGEVRALLPIPEDRQAMSFEVGIPPGVAGFVSAGDTISIVAELESEPPEEIVDEEGEVVEIAEGDVRVQYLVQNAFVLNVGRRVVRTTDEEAVDEVQRDENVVLVTVAVEPNDAEKLTYGILNGTLWLTLLPEDDLPSVATPGRTIENVFD
jgi:pilus assembly protein CpaB